MKKGLRTHEQHQRFQTRCYHRQLLSAVIFGGLATGGSKHHFFMINPYLPIKMNTSENTDPTLCVKQVNHYESLQPMEYDVYKVSIECLERSFDMACDELKAYPKGNLGMTLDSAKDKRWHELRKVKEIYQEGIRKLNRLAPKSYLLKRRDERRAQKHSVSKANECVGA